MKRSGSWVICAYGNGCYYLSQALYDLKQTEGIRAANKLSRLHVQYQENKTKVKLAAQLFSSSVGKALLYLEETGHHQFIGAGVTVRFILLIDQAFDSDRRRAWLAWCA